MDVHQFLTDRLAEDEAAALAASSPHWGVDWTGTSDTDWSSVNVRCESMHDVANLGGWNVAPPPSGFDGELSSEGDVQWSRDRHRFALADADHIARHDPARVLAEVAAKRAVMGLHQADLSGDTPDEFWLGVCGACGWAGLGEA